MIQIFNIFTSFYYSSNSNILRFPLHMLGESKMIATTSITTKFLDGFGNYRQLVPKTRRQQQENSRWLPHLLPWNLLRNMHFDHLTPNVNNTNHFYIFRKKKRFFFLNILNN